MLALLESIVAGLFTMLRKGNRHQVRIATTLLACIAIGCGVGLAWPRRGASHLPELPTVEPSTDERLIAELRNDYRNETSMTRDGDNLTIYVVTSKAVPPRDPSRIYYVYRTMQLTFYLLIEGRVYSTVYSLSNDERGPEFYKCLKVAVVVRSFFATYDDEHYRGEIREYLGRSDAVLYANAGMAVVKKSGNDDIQNVRIYDHLRTDRRGEGLYEVLRHLTKHANLEALSKYYGMRVRIGPQNVGVVQ